MPGNDVILIAIFLTPFTGGTSFLLIGGVFLVGTGVIIVKEVKRRH